MTQINLLHAQGRSAHHKRAGSTTCPHFLALQTSPNCRCVVARSH